MLESTNRSSRKAEKVLRHRRTIVDRFREWIDFANLLPPETDTPAPQNMLADDPIMRALGKRFYRRFEPRRPLSEEEKEQAREDLTVSLERSYPGPRNRKRLRKAVEKDLERIERYGWGEFITFFMWHGGDAPDSGPRPPEPTALYRLFYSVRESLTAISNAGHELHHLGRQSRLELQMPPVREIVVSKDGHLCAGFPGLLGAGFSNPFYDTFVPLILSEEIDIRLVRECGCCRAHRDVLRARRFRENHARYERNRKRNRASKEARESEKRRSKIRELRRVPK
jgi:hypothetical protein